MGTRDVLEGGKGKEKNVIIFQIKWILKVEFIQLFLQQFVQPSTGHCREYIGKNWASYLQIGLWESKREMNRKIKTVRSPSAGFCWKDGFSFLPQVSPCCDALLCLSSLPYLCLLLLTSLQSLLVPVKARGARHLLSFGAICHSAHSVLLRL